MRPNSEKCKEMMIDFSRNYSLTSGIQSVTIGEQVQNVGCDDIK